MSPLWWLDKTNTCFHFSLYGRLSATNKFNQIFLKFWLKCTTRSFEMVIWTVYSASLQLSFGLISCICICICLCICICTDTKKTPMQCYLKQFTQPHRNCSSQSHTSYILSLFLSTWHSSETFLTVANLQTQGFGITHFGNCVRTNEILWSVNINISNTLTL